MDNRKKIVVLTGAGISKESGLDTFRDKDGSWQKKDPMKLSSIDGFIEDPQTVLDFYNSRRAELPHVEPNVAHTLLADLQRDFDVVVITQNVDNLHERAGSQQVIHLHGELSKVTSSASPNDTRYIKTFPFEMPICLGDRADDGSQLRPFIVWFGEAVPKMAEAEIAMQQADIVVIIGTSLSVYPAAGLTHFAPQNTRKYLVDPSEMTVPQGFTHIKMVATAGVQQLVRELRTNRLNNNETPGQHNNFR